MNQDKMALVEELKALTREVKTIAQSVKKNGNKDSEVFQSIKTLLNGIQTDVKAIKESEGFKNIRKGGDEQQNQTENNLEKPITEDNAQKIQNKFSSLMEKLAKAVNR
jgi:hemerythrin-like domain-containing protein